MDRRWLVGLAGLVLVLVAATALGSGHRPSTTATPTHPSVSTGSSIGGPGTDPTAGGSGESPPAPATPGASGPTDATPSAPPSGTLESLAVLLAMLPIAVERRDG